MSDERMTMELERQKKTLRNRGICVLIPTYNNGGTIVEVVSRAMEQCRDVLVMCDGCTDDTVSKLRQMSPAPVVLDLKKNRGKGAALKAGFRYALQAGFSYAITLDGDGQHFPEDIPALLRANQRYPGALIVGERQYDKAMPRSKGSQFANAFSNFWFAVQTGRCLKDTQSGYRLYPLKKLYGLSFLTSRYEAELELMVLASWHGVRLEAEPVRVYYPPSEERVSHFRPGKDFGRIAVLNTVLCLFALVYGWPLRLGRALMTAGRTIYAYLMFWIFAMAVMPLSYIYMGIGPITDRKKYGLHLGLNRVMRFVLLRQKLPGVKYTQGNPYDETYETPAVIICNHQSHLDLIPLMAQTPKLIVLTADWVWHNPLYRQVIRHADFLPVSFGADDLMPKLKDLVAKGYSVAVYPEGTRSVDGRVGRFHQGAFYMADALGLDILPLVLYGAGKVLPKKGWKFRKWPMRLEIDRRISGEERRKMGKTFREQASCMRKYYTGRYEEMADSIERYV